MQLEHTFTVPAPIDQAWQVLTDISQVAPCMPGAELESVDGDDFTGSVKVRLGPIGLTYKGKAAFVEKDATAHRAVISAQGRDARGNGTASATVTAQLSDAGDQTGVSVVTDLTITGKPAQFGRGVMVDVGNKLIGQFADCLAGKLSNTGSPGSPEPDNVADIAEVSPLAAASAAVPPASSAQDDSHAPPTQPAPPAPQPVRPAVEPINLLEAAGPAVLKRVLPAAVVSLIVLLVVFALRRRRG
jgi:carbon monoxide dehydrogenase subunit G